MTVFGFWLTYEPSWNNFGSPVLKEIACHYTGGDVCCYVRTSCKRWPFRPATTLTSEQTFRTGAHDTGWLLFAPCQPRTGLRFLCAHTHADVKQMSQLRERKFRRAESLLFFPPIFCFSTYWFKSRSFPGSVAIKVLVCNYTESRESWLNGERGF